MELCDKYIHELIQFDPTMNDYLKIEKYSHLRSKYPNFMSKEYDEGEKKINRKYLNLVKKKKKKTFYDELFYEDLKEYFQTMYFKDKNNWGILFAFLYASRNDYLSFGQLITNDWNSNNCSGAVLKTFYKNRVPTGKKLTGSSYQGYGGFFWTDKEDLNFRHLSMLGHGGQRIIVNLDAGSVLTMHAIRNNFSTTKLERIFLQE